MWSQKKRVRGLIISKSEVLKVVAAAQNRHILIKRLEKHVKKASFCNRISLSKLNLRMN